MIHPALLDAVATWQAEDPDAETRAELDRLIAADDEAGLRDRFGTGLVFGTAGLRGPLGAGPNRMNRVVVRRTAAAVGRWLDDTDTDGPVVVGRDGRHGSAAFAADTAAVLAGMGRRVIAFDGPIPTPLLAYATRVTEAAAGIMVTASHNPPSDNGYKVYAAGGRQILPDQADAILGFASGVDGSAIVFADPDDPAIERADGHLVDDYLDGVASLRAVESDGVAVAYTPLHGVGRDLLVAAFERCGLLAPVVVAEQAEPDPEFPTVAFPNPEEPGALDAVIATAMDAGVSVAIANDPDADRFAAAVDGPGGWRTLSGDEIGILLADHLLSHGSGPDRLVATTVVSSTMLGVLAAAHGVHHEETLTGFKWLAASAAARPDLAFVLGYEEALGFSIGRHVADKDGISAAVVFCDLVAELAARGVTVIDRLDELAEQFGLHLTRQATISFDGTDGPARMADVVDTLRREPPVRLAGEPLTSMEDLTLGERFPSTDAVILRRAGLRVVVRPSGTEPKLKIYVEAVEAPSADVADARGRASSRIDAVIAEMLALVDAVA